MCSSADYSGLICSSSDITGDTITDAGIRSLDPLTISLMSRLFPGSQSPYSSTVNCCKESGNCDVRVFEKAYNSTAHQLPGILGKTQPVIPHASLLGVVPPIVFNPIVHKLGLTPSSARHSVNTQGPNTECKNVSKGSLDLCVTEGTICTKEEPEDQRGTAHSLPATQSTNTITSLRLGDLTLPLVTNEQRPISSMDQIANLLQVANFHSTPFDSVNSDNTFRVRSSAIPTAAPCVTQCQAKSEEDFCELCQKHFCNKYYLRKHKADVHGITTESYSNSRRRDTMLSFQQYRVPADEINVMQNEYRIPQEQSATADVSNKLKDRTDAIPTNRMHLAQSTGGAINNALGGIVMNWKDVFQTDVIQPKMDQTEILCGVPDSQTLLLPTSMGGNYPVPSQLNGMDPMFSAHFYMMALAQSLPVLTGKTSFPMDWNPVGIMKDEVGNVDTPTMPVMNAEVPSRFSEAKCDHCNKVFCSPYFLQLHRMNQHQRGGDGSCAMRCASESDTNLLAGSTDYQSAYDNALASSDHPRKPLIDEVISQGDTCDRRSSVGPGGSKEGKSTAASLDAFKNSMVAAKMADRVTCELCKKDLCNKYFLRTHKIRVHGVSPRDVGGPPMRNPPIATTGTKQCASISASNIATSCCELEQNESRPPLNCSPCQTIPDISTFCPATQMGPYFTFPFSSGAKLNSSSDESQDSTNQAPNHTLLPNFSPGVAPNPNDHKSWMTLFGGPGPGLFGSDVNDLFSVIVNISCPVCERVIGPRLFLPSHLSDVHGLNPLNPAFFLNMLRAKVVPSDRPERLQMGQDIPVSLSNSKTISHPGSPTHFEETRRNEDFSNLSRGEGEQKSNDTGNRPLRSSPALNLYVTTNMQLPMQRLDSFTADSACCNSLQETVVGTVDTTSSTINMMYTEDSRIGEVVSALPVSDALERVTSPYTSTLSTATVTHPFGMHSSFAMPTDTFAPLSFNSAESATVVELGGSRWAATQNLNGELSASSGLLSLSQASPQMIVSSTTGLPRKSPNQMRVLCDICNKWICNKYFLRTHKANKHGITDVTQAPNDPGRSGIARSNVPPKGTQNLYYRRGLPTVAESPERVQKNKVNLGIFQENREQLLLNGDSCIKGDHMEVQSFQTKSQAAIGSVLEQLSQAWKWNCEQTSGAPGTAYPILGQQIPTGFSPILGQILPLSGLPPSQLLNAFPSTVFPQSTLFPSLLQTADVGSTDNKPQTSVGTLKTDQPPEYKSDKKTVTTFNNVHQLEGSSSDSCDCKVPLNLSLKCTKQSNKKEGRENMDLSKLWRRHRARQDMLRTLRYITVRSLKRACSTYRCRRNYSVRSTMREKQCDGSGCGESNTVKPKVRRNSTMVLSKVRRVSKVTGNNLRSNRLLRTRRAHLLPSHATYPTNLEESEIKNSPPNIAIGNTGSNFCCPLCSTTSPCEFGTLNLLLQHLTLVHGGCDTHTEEIARLHDPRKKQSNGLTVKQTQALSFQVSHLASSPNEDDSLAEDKEQLTNTVDISHINNTMANIMGTCFTPSVISSTSDDYCQRDNPVSELIRRPLFIPTNSYTETLSGI